MKFIKKGSIITHDSYIISDAERKEYLQLKEKVNKVREMYKEYEKQYKS